MGNEMGQRVLCQVAKGEPLWRHGPGLLMSGQCARMIVRYEYI